MNFLEQFHRFFWGCKIDLKYTLKCSYMISSSDNKKILLIIRNVMLDSGRYTMQHNTISNECFRFKFHWESMVKIQYFLLSNALSLLRFSCCHKEVEALQFIEVIQVGWLYDKVQLFCEGHKNLCDPPYGFDVYLKVS